MSKWAFNYDSGEYEEIESIELAVLEVNIYNCNDRKYHREDEEVERRKNRIFNYDEDELFC